MTVALKLNPDPTFRAKVGIPVAGAEKPALVEFTFKHRPRSVLGPWAEQTKGAKDVDLVLDCATGWELTDEFNRENVERLCDNYPGAGLAVLRTYMTELAGLREKN